MLSLELSKEVEQHLRECENRSNQEVFGHFGSIGKEKRRFKQWGER
jgi:hypothetical protein